MKRLLPLFFCSIVLDVFAAGECASPLDTYGNYDNQIPRKQINDVKSEYYVLSYTWTPRYCAKLGKDQTKPGSKDYLQCGSGKQFGYVLHGFWPQGRIKASGNYPRACEGDQQKIDRKLLENYLCMTPSVWLLQHEYEYHGTCMHDETLEEPRAYFDKALELHNTLKLPDRELPGDTASIQWFMDNNPQFKQGSVQYSTNSKEWQFCYDNTFTSMTCPANARPANIGQADDCPVKGNISSSGKKYYFTSAHANYAAVRISRDKGEKCFSSAETARAAGWLEAP
ncbi:ribonuclease T2 family protein [Azomonas macrocytogenes]|uniref:Ribonuclease T2 n=1 Tax=Azomonas macrocytogenes TaxID=69962 RepID=A0A839T3H5_AZOMA|nr:hypothetical protein [Azomonas macrocytogenes]MBB3102293.1 ribonuclease T2 [Azomonas macrocytogenes]